MVAAGYGGGTGGVPRLPVEGLRAVVFDLDGTLVDTMALIPAAYATTIRALGGPAVTPGDVVAAWYLGASPVVLAHFLGRPVQDGEIEVFHRHVSGAIAEARVFPGVAAMLDDLRADGYLLGVYTGAGRRGAAEMLRHTGLDRHLAAVVCGDEVDRPKPAPDGLLLACRTLGVPPAATAYVGDSDADRECARAAGAHWIHAAWTAPGAGDAAGRK